MLIPVSGARAAQQRSTAGTYTLTLKISSSKTHPGRLSQSACKRLDAISKATGMSTK